MYKLLIVDDEPIAVNLLAESFQQEMQQEMEVYKAYSSSEALAWLDRMKIDIVLSDIRMPGMSGLDLLERIKLNWPACRVIFLTGFREFDYVYSAIQNGVDRYLLKTEPDKTIIKAVREVLTEMEASFKEENIVNRAKQLMNQALPLLRKEFLQQLLDEEASAEHNLQERLYELHIPLVANRQTVMVVGRFDQLSTSLSFAKRDELHYSLQLLAEDYIPGIYQQHGFLMEHTFFIWLLQPATDEAFTEKHFVLLQGALQVVQDACRHTLDLTVSFALSAEAFFLEGCSDEYHRLKQMVGYRIGTGHERIVTSKSCLPTETDRGESTSGSTKLISSYKQLSRINKLLNYMEASQTEAFFQLFGAILDGLRYLSNAQDTRAFEIYFSTSNVLLNYLNRWNMYAAVSEKIDLQRLLRIDQHESWNAAVDYLYACARTIFETQSHQETKWAADMVKDLQQYIEANLGADLTLTTLADLVHLNPSYLSRLYKQVTGKNLSDSINEMRMDKAKSLLQHSTKKINEISREVGYESQQSFTRFFKNSAGLTPQEYRESLNK